MDNSSPLTSEECVRLRTHWRILSDYEQAYFRANSEAFLAWLRRQAVDIFDKIASTISIEPDWLDASLINCLD